MKIQNAALIGMGAVGSVYGKLLFQKYKDNFFVIANKDRKEKIIQNGITVNGETFYPNILDDNSKNKSLDLIIITVKNYSLDNAIDDLKNLVNENTILLPLLNGVTATERLKTAFPSNVVFYGLSMGIDAVKNEKEVINTVNGTIQFGYADNRSIKPEVLAVQDFLEEANIDCAVFKDMKRMVWKKYMLNVGWNQVSALTNATYGEFLKAPYIKELIERAMLEVVHVAKALNINLTEKDVTEINSLMDSFSPSGKTSMLQDMEKKKISEVDYFSGTLLKYGEKLNIETPVNEILYKLIKSIEALY